MKTKLEQNLHDNQVEHIDDGSTKDIISDLFKSLEAREPGKAIDTILKQVLTEQAVVCTCNIHWKSFVNHPILFLSTTVRN